MKPKVEITRKCKHWKADVKKGPPQFGRCTKCGYWNDAVVSYKVTGWNVQLAKRIAKETEKIIEKHIK